MASILDYNTSINSDFLHANGESATDLLIGKLNIQGNEKILEFGIGTGATLVKLKSKFPSIDLTGIDASYKMLEVAHKRIRFCGLKNKVTLVHSKNKSNVQAISLDIVYAESVLGILNTAILRETLNYFNTVLKNDGVLIINESIWLSHLTESKIENINQACLDKFGIIQCSTEFKSLTATIALFKSFNFTNISYERIRKKDIGTSPNKTMREKLSKLFTYSGKIKLLFQPNLKKIKKDYNKKMTSIFEEEKEYLSGVVMVFKKSTL